MTDVRPPRLPRWLRSSHDLPLPRVRNRVSSYLYGNILVLAAVVATSPEAIMHWTAVIVVAATTLTTFLAHVVAHSVGQQLGRSPEETRVHLRDEFRDAVPIVTSGTIPIVVLVFGALMVLNPLWSQGIAALILVVRIALTGMQVERVSRDRSSFGVLWTGILLAVACFIIVILKVLFTH